MPKPPSLPLVRLPSQATIHRFGTPPSSPRSSALLRFGEIGWTISREAKQGWAIVGDSEGRRHAVETLLSRHRIHPVIPPPGPFPYITSLLTPSSSSSSPPSSFSPSFASSSSSSPSSSPSSSSSSSSAPTDVGERPKPVRHLAFARPPPSGEFTDFTARYGALQEEDKQSFRQTLSSLHPSPTPAEIERVAKTMRIDHLLDLPNVSLSSGQTRRARIAAALLSRPVLLLLEDPMAGLDTASRKEVSETLGELNDSGEIRIVLVLKGHGKGKGMNMPEWVDEVCEVRKGDVRIGSRSDWEDRQGIEDGERVAERKIEGVDEERTGRGVEGKYGGEPVVKLDGVSVSYGEGTRQVQVLKHVSWTIMPGEKWHLQGANGSGKTTLLSLILGHHPRSFSLPPSSLTLFGKPRRSTPTPTLRTLIGHVSPEIFAAFPRGMGLSAEEVIGSGFEGVFSRRALTLDQKRRVRELIEFMGPHLTSSRSGPALAPEHGKSSSAVEVGKKLFSHFTPPQQTLLLFLRAIVAKPPLLILDEPSQGMDEVIWARCRELLALEWRENPEMGVVVVSHYEEEVPWREGRGKVLRLDQGVADVASEVL